MLLYLPAIFALLFKFFLLFYGGKAYCKNKSSKTLLALLIILTVCNFMELIGYRYLDNPEAIVIFLRVYYVSVVMLLAFLLQLSLLTAYKSLDKKVELLIFSISTLACGLLLLSDLVISGATSIGYSITRIPGKLYWIVPVYSFVLLFCSLAVLTHGYKKARNQFRKIQSFYIFLAVCCLAFPILVAIALMAMGLKVNAAFILPIGISFFLCLISYAIKSEQLFDIRIWLPFSTRYKLMKAINSEFMVSRDGSEMLAKDRRKNHEKIFLLKALLDYRGILNQKEIAARMGISESSLSKKRKEYNI